MRKLPGSVWELATEPLKVPTSLGVDHFAAFPTEWPRRIITGWSPSGICTACGQGRRPMVDRQRETHYGEGRWRSRRQQRDDAAITGGVIDEKWSTQTTITGYCCARPDTAAPTRPAIVLDPFGGTGTTTLVAKALGRHGISIDRSSDYCRLAAWRTRDPSQLAKALGVLKPPAQMLGQSALFDMEAS